VDQVTAVTRLQSCVSLWLLCCGGNGERMPWGYVSRPVCTECRTVV